MISVREKKGRKEKGNGVLEIRAVEGVQHTYRSTLMRNKKVPTDHSKSALNNCEIRKRKTFQFVSRHV